MPTSPKRLRSATKTTATTAVKISVLTVGLAAVISGGALLAQAAGFAPGFSIAAVGSTLGVPDALLPQIAPASVVANTSTVVAGQKNAYLETYRLIAPSTVDMRVESIILDVYGSQSPTGPFTLGAANNFLSKCSLRNSVGTIVAGPTGVSPDGRLELSFPNYVIPKGTFQSLRLTCDVMNPGLTQTTYLSFDFHAPADADTVKNNVTPGLIAINASTIDALLGRVGAADDKTPNNGTAPKRVIAVSPQGTLTVSVDPATPSSDIILAPSTNMHVATYRFTPSLEAFNINTITFREEQATDDFSDTYKERYTNNISSVTIVATTVSGTVTKTTTMVGNEAKFTGLDLRATSSVPLVVKVLVTTPMTDYSGIGVATSNEKIRLGFATNTTTDANFKAVGGFSGKVLDDDDVLPQGDDATDGVGTFTVRQTRPTISISPSTPAGPKPSGRQEVFRFNVAAAANEDMSVRQILFKINATDLSQSGWLECDTDGRGVLTPADFDLYDLTGAGIGTALDATHSAVWRTIGANGADCNTSLNGNVGYAAITFSTPFVIPQGSTKTLSLYADTVGASVADHDSFQVSIPAESAVTTQYLRVSNANVGVGTVPFSQFIDVASGAQFSVGDILVFDADDNGTLSSNEERMLVTEKVTNRLVVIRGYMNSPITQSSSVSNGDDIYRFPSPFVWLDETAGNPYQTTWGAGLVKNLPINGGTITF